MGGKGACSPWACSLLGGSTGFSMCKGLREAGASTLERLGRTCWASCEGGSASQGGRVASGSGKKGSALGMRDQEVAGSGG